MNEWSRPRGSRILRDTYGSSSGEAFMIIAIVTILVTRLYLHLTNYPQVGGGSLHIAHALYGGAMMMLALLIGWTFLGFTPRVVCIVVGGIGFGLFLDEVGKFVTKDNDYFYGPAAEVMYVLVLFLLVIGRVVRDIKPPTAAECLANAAAIAAEGVAHGLPDHRRQWASVLLQSAETRGADRDTVDHIRGLLAHAAPVPARLKAMQDFAPRLIPSFFRSPKWIPVVGWVLVVVAFLGLAFGAIGVALGGWFYEDDHVTLELAGLSVATFLLLLSAAVTFLLAFPAMVALKKTDKLWPLRFLRNAALIFTLLNALVDFATEGFGAVVSLGIGLFTLAILTYQLNVRIAEKVKEAAARVEVAA